MLIGSNAMIEDIEVIIDNKAQLMVDNKTISTLNKTELHGNFFQPTLTKLHST